MSSGTTPGGVFRYPYSLDNINPDDPHLAQMMDRDRALEDYISSLTGGGADPVRGFLVLLLGTDTTFSLVQNSQAAAALPLTLGSEQGFAAYTTIPLGPLSLGAGGQISTFMLGGTNNTDPWDVAWSYFVANAARTESLYATSSSTAAAGAGPFYPPNTGVWSVATDGTDLTLVDGGGFAVVQSTAGGVYWGIITMSALATT